MALQKIYKRYKSELLQIESDLVTAVASRNNLLHLAGMHLLEAGGKRLRPLLVLMAGQFGEKNSVQLYKVAVILELIHMATLVHDDVIDNAATRRGQETVKARWDNQIAMVSGDYLFTKALQLAVEIEDNRYHHILSGTILEMCRGEIKQLIDAFNDSQTPLYYLRRVKRKTALLISISCQLGALTCSTDTSTILSLTAYGFNMGMAFQLIDDVLDFTADEAVLGKPIGSDLKQGNITLPVIYALQHSPDKELIRNYLHLGGSLAHIIEIVRTSGGLDYTAQVAERYLEKAFNSLDPLPSCCEKNYLEQVAQFMVKRSY